MADSRRPSPPVDLGIYSRETPDSGMDPADMVALTLTAVWLVICAAFLGFVGLGEAEGLGPLRFAIVALAILVPVGLIWIAAIAIKSARILREESERLQASVDAIRQVHVAQAQTASTVLGPSVERKIEEIAQGQRRTETAIAHFVTSRGSAARPTPRPPAADPGESREPAEEQPTLGLVAQSEAERRPVATADFIAALNFPETVEDKAGFDALRRALADPCAARLIRASQDVLTLLSQDGIYMDDLAPERARPEIWRRFASGERGRTVAALGGIRDRSSLALSAGRMRQDSIFRDAVHHFLRTFDKTLAQVVDELTDEELIALADTRTARAFMLLGRVAGTFD